MSASTAEQRRRTKIIATVGPASNSEERLKSLIRTGVNVFRLNMSHGTHEEHEAVFHLIRRLSEESDSHIAILVDLCGPKIRVGRFEDGQIELTRNMQVLITADGGLGGDGRIITQYRNLYRDVEVGDRVLLDDGNLELQVERLEGRDVHCKVVVGGVLKDRKGMNLPDSPVSVDSFTDKDKADVDLAMRLGADFVALSFVRTAKDVTRLTRYMDRNGHAIQVIAKIEKPEAVENIDDILSVSYGIMIARGDLGIELPAEKVPLLQRDLIRRARLTNQPVIVATQMLESMITNARPTRAEVGDVANAAILGSDAVMLSAETAAGNYPLKAVKTMDSILREIEQNQSGENSDSRDSEQVDRDNSAGSDHASERQAIANAASSLARALDLKGIMVPTRSGVTARIVSAVRPNVPLLGLSSRTGTLRLLALQWGVIPVRIDEVIAKNWSALVSEVSTKYRLTRRGEKVILVSGVHDDKKISEPVIKIMGTGGKQ